MSLWDSLLSMEMSLIWQTDGGRDGWIDWRQINRQYWQLFSQMDEAIPHNSSFTDQHTTHKPIPHNRSFTDQHTIHKPIPRNRSFTDQHRTHKLSLLFCPNFSTQITVLSLCTLHPHKHLKPHISVIRYIPCPHTNNPTSPSKSDVLDWDIAIDHSPGQSALHTSFPPSPVTPAGYSFWR